MNYIDAVDILKEIEQKYDVMSIRYRGVSVWPYLRCYLIDMLGYNKARKPSTSNAIFILRNLFRYNPLVIRKQMDIWSYSGVITRKKIGNLYHHHSSGVLPQIDDKVLNWEKPDPSKPHFNKNEIPEKYIVSNSWSIFLTRAAEYFLRFIPFKKIENGYVMEKINLDYNINYNYKYRVRMLYAQKIATDILLFFAKKPKLIAMECPYDQMGYVWSFHKHGLKVIEFQHGVLNANHYGYNSMFNGGILAPDAICVYGDEEYNYLKGRDVPFCERVEKTGLFIMEKANQYFKEDLFEGERRQYKKIIVAAGQNDFEEIFLRFIDETASLDLENLYVYIPRKKCDLKKIGNNVRIVFDVNIYEYLKWCDVHCTVSSTTCLESQYFNKPNIFVEFNDTARIYYSSVIKEENGSFFVKTPREFVEKISFCTDRNFKFRNLFSKGNLEQTYKVINSYM